MAIFQDLNREGATMVMVTHEPEIAKHTDRILRFRDGALIEDHNVDEPVNARNVLAELPLEEEDIPI